MCQACFFRVEQLLAAVQQTMRSLTLLVIGSPGYRFSHVAQCTAVLNQVTPVPRPFSDRRAFPTKEEPLPLT